MRLESNHTKLFELIDENGNVLHEYCRFHAIQLAQMLNEDLDDYLKSSIHRTQADEFNKAYERLVNHYGRI